MDALMDNLSAKGKEKIYMDVGIMPTDDPRMQIYRPRLVALLDEEDGRGVPNAQIAREVGVTSDTLGKWKSRGSMPQDPWQFMLLCRRLNTHPNYLIGWTDSRYPEQESAHAKDLDAEIARRRKR